MVRDRSSHVLLVGSGAGRTAALSTFFGPRRAEYGKRHKGINEVELGGAGLCKSVGVAWPLHRNLGGAWRVSPGPRGQWPNKQPEAEKKSGSSLHLHARSLRSRSPVPPFPASSTHLDIGHPPPRPDNLISHPAVPRGLLLLRSICSSWPTRTAHCIEHDWPVPGSARQRAPIILNSDFGHAASPNPQPQHADPRPRLRPRLAQVHHPRCLPCEVRPRPTVGLIGAASRTTAPPPQPRGQTFPGPCLSRPERASLLIAR